MRALYAGVFVLAAASWAQAKKPRGKLACTLTEESGKTSKVPSKGLKLSEDTQVVCHVSIAADDAAAVARVQTSWPDRDAHGARITVTGQELTGPVAGKQPFQAVLAPDRDYKLCLAFTIDARILDGKGRLGWRKTLRVTPTCPP